MRQGVESEGIFFGIVRKEIGRSDERRIRMRQGVESMKVFLCFDRVTRKISRSPDCVSRPILLYFPSRNPNTSKGILMNQANSIKQSSFIKQPPLAIRQALCPVTGIRYCIVTVCGKARGKGDSNDSILISPIPQLGEKDWLESLEQDTDSWEAQIACLLLAFRRLGCAKEIHGSNHAHTNVIEKVVQKIRETTSLERLIRVRKQIELIEVGKTRPMLSMAGILEAGFEAIENWLEVCREGWIRESSETPAMLPKRTRGKIGRIGRTGQLENAIRQALAGLEKLDGVDRKTLAELVAASRLTPILIKDAAEFSSDSIVRQEKLWTWGSEIAIQNQDIAIARAISRIRYALSSAKMIRDIELDLDIDSSIGTSDDMDMDTNSNKVTKTKPETKTTVKHKGKEIKISLNIASFSNFTIDDNEE